MQSKQKFAYIALSCVLFLSSVVLLINVQAQAPKEAQIAFFSNRDGNVEICVMDTDGNEPRNLTNNPADDGWPAWFHPAFARPVHPAGKQATTWGWLKQNSE